MNRSIRFAGVAGLVGLALAPADAAIAAGPCRMDEAVALFEKRQWGLASPALSDCAAAADPKNAHAAEYLGRALLAQGQENEAIPWLENAVTLQPDNSEAHLWLRRAYAQQAIHANFLKQASLAMKIHKPSSARSHWIPSPSRRGSR